jgi:hypothetical protein
MDEKFWLPTGAAGWPVEDEALNGLSDEARRNLLDGVRANIKQLKASRLAPPLDVAEAIRAFEAMARRLEASFPGQPRQALVATAGAVIAEDLFHVDRAEQARGLMYGEYWERRER